MKKYGKVPASWSEEAEVDTWADAIALEKVQRSDSCQVVSLSLCTCSVYTHTPKTCFSLCRNLACYGAAAPVTLQTPRRQQVKFMESDMCYQCSAKFTIFTRRHHCRCWVGALHVRCTNPQPVLPLPCCPRRRSETQTHHRWELDTPHTTPCPRARPCRYCGQSFCYKHVKHNTTIAFNSDVRRTTQCPALTLTPLLEEEAALARRSAL
jgi:hypothetical protein